MPSGTWKWEDSEDINSSTRTDPHILKNKKNHLFSSLVYYTITAHNNRLQMETVSHLTDGKFEAF